MDATGVLSAYVEVETSRHHVVAELMPETGFEKRVSSQQFLVTEVTTRHDTVSISVRHCHPQLRFEGPLFRMYVLRNRKRNEAVVLMPHYVLRPFSSFGPWQSSLIIEHMELVLPSVGISDADLSKIDRQWMDESELLVIEEVDLGRFKKHLLVEDFVFEQEDRS